MIRKNSIFSLPNLLTSFRIVGALILLFSKPFTPLFYAVFVLCGLSDALDGLIARAMKCCSEFGAKLDSIADLSFYSVMLLRVLPFLWTHLPKYVFIFAAVIILIRITIYVYVGIKYHCFASVHTYANKLTGFSLFIVPLVAETPLLLTVCLAVCILGAYACIEELIIHLISKSYSTETKTLLPISFGKTK